MLENISVNALIKSRPQSSKSVSNSQRLKPRPKHYEMENNQSIFLNPEKIILPVKEYSNKFLREGRTREDFIYSQSLMKPKKSMVYVRKQLKSRKGKIFKNKENYKNLKTQTFHSQSKNEAPSTANSQLNMDKVSTSRALEMFSKVTKKQGIGRMKIRREIMNKTTDVQIKQVVLGEKQEKSRKKIEYPKNGRNFPIQPFSCKKNYKNAFDDENFQIAGW